MQRILCVHQGAELYGSDRSFASAVNGLKTNKVDVVLPFNGELVEYLDKTMGKYGLIAMVFCVKRCKNTKFLFNTVRGVKYYLHLYKRYDVIYINTVVMLSALVAAMFYRFCSKRKYFVMSVKYLRVGNYHSLNCFSR
ncbi:hypothetical protein [Klebsiella pneumoniae]|uniref:hypothetical protein n=1 Tax=Klebsiella pneumoniae TaxID=573 RepID=UPI000F52A067|nr:hypothetical protein [Klebsiella pneumoniae]